MALGDLFAPAYIRSDPNSVQRVNDWQAQNFGMTNQGVEATRHPVGFNTGNPAGMVDPEALRQLAQGGPRNAIAAQAVTAPAAAAPAPAPAGNPQWAAMRAQMSPSDLATFQRSVSPEEFAAFMAA
jgi:hypothetical protein